MSFQRGKGRCNEELLPVRQRLFCKADCCTSNLKLRATETSFVWPDRLGKTTGIALEPIHTAVTSAIRQDPALYGYLALLDSIREGNVRERQLAAKILAQQWGIT